jgi:glycosyltransferase involved in cell wall biosynthesis
MIALGIDRPIDVRPNGVEFETLLPLPARGALRSRLDIPVEAPVVLTLARLGRVKRLPMLVEAIRALPGVHAVIAGPDEHDGTLEAVRRAAAASSVEARTHVVEGGLWGSDKVHAFADADAFCLPSSYESFGTAAAEAAGVGLPVVVTDRCGVADVMDRRSARIVSVRTPDALTEGLRDVLSADLKEAAVQRAASFRERLTWGALAGDQARIYRSAPVAEQHVLSLKDPDAVRERDDHPKRESKQATGGEQARLEDSLDETPHDAGQKDGTERL